MERAARLGHYLVAHARAAFGQIGSDPAVGAARHVLSWIERTGVSSFTKRDAFEGTKGRFKRVAALEPVLGLLIEHDYIRGRGSAERLGPGRKSSPVFEVNPMLHGDLNSANSANSAKGTEPSPPETPLEEDAAPVAEAAAAGDSHNSHNSQNARPREGRQVSLRI
jgi:hypothetical protein